MKHGSLFSGIGGFDLAAQWMGWQNVFHCEIDPFCRQILNYYWPKSESYEDIKTTDFTIWRGRIDILTGGFPCQPYSTAGRRKGTEDERHLWPEMLRAIREIRPKWIVGENVYGIISWNKGLVFEQVQTDLENEGYKVQPVLLPAAGINAPHIRQRVWFVAYSESIERNISETTEWEKEPDIIRNGEFESFTNPPIDHRPKRRIDQDKSKKAKRKSFRHNTLDIRDTWKNFPTQQPICGGNDGLSNRLDGITFSKHRAKTIEGFGNAIVPQLLIPIFEVIEEMTKNF